MRSFVRSSARSLAVKEDESERISSFYPLPWSSSFRSSRRSSSMLPPVRFSRDDA